MGSGFSKMKKQARLLEKQMQEMEEERKNTKAEGEAGGGLVKVEIDGEHTLQKITINPDCVDPEDVEGLECLIVEAMKAANQKIKEKMPSPTGGLPF